MEVKLPNTIEQNIQHFTGRTWLLPQLLRWLEETEDRMFMLTGEPGTGKSMIVAWLAGAGPLPGDAEARAQLEQIRSLIKAVHFCVAASGSVSPTNFAENVANQLTHNVSGFSDALAATLEDRVRISTVQQIGKMETGSSVTGVHIERLDLGGLGEELSFEQALHRPLWKLYTNGYNQPIFLLVDALDEAATYTGTIDLVRLLVKLSDLPQNVRVLVTTRPDPRVLKFYNKVKPFDPLTDAPEDVNDVRLYAYERLAELEHKPRNKLADRIAQAAQGIFLYAHLVINDLLARLPEIPDLDTVSLPKGLSGLYHDFLNRELGSEEDRWYATFKPLLGLIAVAQGDGLTRTQIEHILSSDVEQPLRLCKQYLSGNLPAGPFRLFHQSFSDFLLEDMENLDYHIDAIQMHGRITEYYLKKYDKQWKDCDPYGLRYLPTHLSEAGQAEALRELLLDFEWLQAKLDATDFTTLITDYELLLDDADLCLVQETLQLSGHVLTHDKAQLAGQLLGRLLSYGMSTFEGLLGQAKCWKTTPWLRPLTATLTTPGGPLLQTLIGHSEAVNAVTISADGTLAVSGSKDHTLRVWNLNDQTCLYTLIGHTDEVNAVLVASTSQGLIAVSGAGKRLPFKVWLQIHSFVERTDRRPSRDTTIKIWDLRTGNELNTLEGHTEAVRCLAVYKSVLFSGSDDCTIRIWDLEEKRSLGVLGNHGAPVVLLAVVRGGRMIMSFSETDFKLWDLASMRELGDGHCEHVWQNILAVYPDRLLLAMQETNFNGDRYYLTIWDILNSEDNNEKLDRITWFESSFNVARFLDDGKRILTGGTDQIIRLIDVTSGKEVGYFEGHKDEITSIDVLTEEAKMLSASADGALLLWKLDCPQAKGTSIEHSDDVNAVAISRDGKCAVSGSFDRSIIVWNIRDGSRLQVIPGHRQSVVDVAISSDGQRILSCSNDKTIRMWSVQDGTQLLNLTGHTGKVTRVAFNHDENFIISASSDHTLKVWDLASGHERCTLEGHQYGIRALALLHHKNVAVSGDESGRLIFWDLQDGQELMRVECFSNDAKLSEVTKILWDVATGPQWRPSSRERFIPCIESLAITPDDRFLVVALRDSPIRVWNIEQRTEHLTLSGHSGIVYSVVVSPDGRRVVSASDDNTLRIWDLMTGTNICTFTADSSLYCCAIGPDSKMIVAGEGNRSGRIHFLYIEAADY
jgi:WD40 repeat protein